MNERTKDTDVVVVGAGAAGLAATKILRAGGYSAELLEAKERMGGRAWTDTHTFGAPVDWGCHWLHSASINPFREMADKWKFEYDTRVAKWRMHLGDRWESNEELESRNQYWDQCDQALAHAYTKGQEVPITDILPRHDKWKPLYLFVLQATTTAAPERLSTLDLGSYNETHEDWPVKNGYGALVARYGENVDVRLNTIVKKIRYSGNIITVNTNKGDIRTAKVILTVSTNVLVSGDIKFDPRLPDWKLFAASHLPLGQGGKVVFKVKTSSPLPEHQYVTYDPSIPHAVSFQIRPFAHNTVIGYFGGPWCSEFKEIDSAEAVDFARQELVKMYGSSVTKDIANTKCVMWHNDPYVQGTYSNALPGHAQQREQLAQPVDDWLYFAGEATSKDAFSTAHGAYQSGIHAAALVALQLPKH